jgi:tRNA (guanine37-N1)-methyltransferase
MDGRDFVKKAISDLDKALSTGDKWKTFDHFVMNLPATAIEFLGKLRLTLGYPAIAYNLLNPIMAFRCFPRCVQN